LQINFKCGTSDQIKYVSEKETCLYSVKFDTPAACPDLSSMQRTWQLREVSRRWCHAGNKDVFI